MVLPNSASKEQLTVVCADGERPARRRRRPNAADACKFTKELKVGYWLVLDKNTVGGVPPPIQRGDHVSIKSDTELTVDADFTLRQRHDVRTAADVARRAVRTLVTSLAAAGEWTYVACPPRIGQRAAVGRGHHRVALRIRVLGFQRLGRDRDGGGADDSIRRASGAATLKKHRIVGTRPRGSRRRSA